MFLVPLGVEVLLDVVVVVVLLVPVAVLASSSLAGTVARVAASFIGEVIGAHHKLFWTTALRTTKKNTENESRI